MGYDNDPYIDEDGEPLMDMDNFPASDDEQPQNYEAGAADFHDDADDWRTEPSPSSSKPRKRLIKKSDQQSSIPSELNDFEDDGGLGDIPGIGSPPAAYADYDLENKRKSKAGLALKHGSKRHKEKHVGSSSSGGGRGDASAAAKLNSRKRKGNAADPEMKEMWDTVAGGDSEDDKDGVRTADDDYFIDDTGVDPAERYRSDNEAGSPSRFAQADEGEDDEINTLFKMGKKKKKNEKSAQEISFLVEQLIAEFEVAAEDDAILNSEGKPAINKLKKLPLLTEALSKKQLQHEFLDHGVLTSLKTWLEPLPDGSLPNINIREAILRILTDFPLDLEQHDAREQLKRSGLGKVIMFLSRSDEETTSNRKLAKDLVDKWSRPIFNKSTRFEDMRNADDERVLQRRAFVKKMDYKIVLRMNYVYNEKLDVVVDDPDRCTILDIFVDLIEGASKNGMVLPAQPTLWYTYESQNRKLESDDDLMKMFSVFCEKKLIKLEIGSAEVPSKTLELARGLIEEKMCDISTHSEPQLLQNVIPPKSSHASNSSHSDSYGRKVPKTTAKRKGIFVPKVSPVCVSTSQQKSENISIVGGAMQMSNLEVLSVNIGAELQSVEEGVQIDEIVSPGSKDGCDPNTDNGFDNDTDDVYFDGLYDNGKPCEENDFGKIKLTEWMFFLSREHLMDVIREYCIQEGFFIVVLKVDEERYTAVCGQEECDWRIHSSRLVDGVTWAIKTLKGIHSCRRLNLHNPMATAEWASRKILEDVRKNEGIQGKDINDLLFKQFGIKMKLTSLYKARKLALDMIRGDDDTSFQNLPTYCEILKSTNAGSMAHCVWKVFEENPEKPIQFRSIFIALRPMIGGCIQGCRRLIAVDGAHMKSKYNGVVLAACGLDAESQIFPIAYGVYENESTQTWSSFFHNLKGVLRDAHTDNWTIISDRQKGVEPSLQKVWPEAERRFCCQHLYANFKKLFPGELVKNCFWECCKAYSEFAFRKAMKKLEKIAGLGAVQWLQKVGDMKCWARFKYDPDLKSPETTSNWPRNKTSGLESKDDDLDLHNSTSENTSGQPSSRLHASRPEAMAMDFVVRPQSKIDPDEIRARAKQQIQDQRRLKMNKKLQHLKSGKKKQLQATRVSVEGRGMVKYL